MGGLIEDSTNRAAAPPLYDVELAADRVRAAAEAARSLSFTFTLPGRAENFLVGQRDVADVVRRLQAYQEAGADVLYTPGLSTKEDVVSVAQPDALEPHDAPDPDLGRSQK